MLNEVYLGNFKAFVETRNQRYGSFTLAVNTGSDVQGLACNALASSQTSAAVTVENTPPTFSNFVATSPKRAWARR